MDSGNQTVKVTAKQNRVSRQKRAVTADGILAIVLIVLYGIIFACTFVPRIGWTILIILSCALDLMIYVGIPLAFTGLLTLTVARLFMSRERDKVFKRFFWNAVKDGINCFGTIGILVFLYSAEAPGYVSKTQGFWFDMKVRADIPDIRAWCERFVPGGEGDGTGQIYVEWEQWPKCIRKLSPQYVRVDKGMQIVTLTFGGGFGHWGLVVAPKGTTKPEGGYSLKLGDGAWVWHEIQ